MKAKEKKSFIQKINELDKKVLEGDKEAHAQILRLIVHEYDSLFRTHFKGFQSTYYNRERYIHNEKGIITKIILPIEGNACYDKLIKGKGLTAKICFDPVTTQLIEPTNVEGANDFNENWNDMTSALIRLKEKKEKLEKKGYQSEFYTKTSLWNKDNKDVSELFGLVYLLPIGLDKNKSREFPSLPIISALEDKQKLISIINDFYRA